MGRYQLVDRLAVGGMAEVFLATERGSLALDRLLVIKRILPHLAQDKAFVEMFLNEARIAARIQHPNVVQIYELGESGGFPFIAMEYVPGSTLKELIKASNATKQPIPIPVAVELISQACAGAHAAHELTDPSGQPYGLVHRDLTPHNLIVTDDGHIKLLDFGIAKASELQGADATRTGMLKGKISYMSPEQCRQEDLDRRSDIFALGICAWELLAGRKPFDGRSELATMQAIVRGDLEDIREVRPDVPEGVARAIHRALNTKRDTRWQTADQFRTRLREAARLDGLPADPDATAVIVADLLGARHQAQRKQVDAAMERTLVTLSQVPPAEVLARIESEESGRMTASLTPARAGVAVGALGTLVVGGTGLVAVAAGALIGWTWWNAPKPPPPRPEGVAVQVVIAPTLSQQTSVGNLEPVFRLYLEQRLQVPFDLVVATSYEDAANRLVAGEFPYAVLPDGVTRDAMRDHPDLQVLATKIMDGSSTTDGYLVVRRDAPFATVADLAGAKICFPDRESSTGYKLPRKALAAAGIDPDTGVTWVESGDHEQVVKDVYDKRCDVGGTYSLNFHGAGDYGVPVSLLSILNVTGRTPHDHLVARPDADAALSARITDALVAFDPKRDLGVDGVGDTEKLTGFARGDGLQK